MEGDVTLKIYDAPPGLYTITAGTNIRAGVANDRPLISEHRQRWWQTRGMFIRSLNRELKKAANT